MGLIVLYASHLVAPERLYPWLGLTSGTVIMAVGAWLLAARARGVSGGGHTHHPHDGRAHLHAGAAASSGPVGQNAGTSRINWKSLTALGVVGGLLPSASAVIILLAAVSLNRIEIGLLLILAFSVGMAAGLTTVGLTLVYSRRFLYALTRRARFASAIEARIPLMTGLVVLGSGLIVVTRAVYQIGLI